MAKNKGGKIMFIKFVARMTEGYFYLCLFLGFLASIFICFWGVLKSWNLFVKSKGEFLEWLKVWQCKEYISKEGTSIVDVPSLKQIKNDHDLKFLEHPFDAASYLVDYYFPIK